MKKILLTILFLSFTFGLQAQVSSTSTGTSVSDDGFGTSIINIAAPNSSGFSNNTYSNFNISNNGIILNNSGSTSASQLTGRDVNGNANITAGNEASLILNQVTSNNSSLLEGTLEVAGTTAGVIIANPNGISCDGCGFINASRIDIIGGTRESDGSFNLSDTTINITGSGLNASGSELNLISNFHTIDASVQAGTNLRILSGNGSYDADNFAITSVGAVNEVVLVDNGRFVVDIATAGNLQAENIEVVVTKQAFKNCGVIDAANDFNATVIGTVVGDRQYNWFMNGFFGGWYDCGNAVIKANNFNVTTELFYNLGGSTIDVANDFNVTVIRDNGEISSGTFQNNDSVIIANDFTVTLKDNTFLNSNNGLINVANNIDLTLTGGGLFQNSDHSSIVADKFALSIERDFQFNKAVEANIFDIRVGGKFTHNDARNNFVWNEQDVLVVQGIANITVNDFSNYGSIDINTFNVTAYANFSNFAGAVIDANSFNATVAGLFQNSNGAIDVANDFNVTAENFFNEFSEATINTDTFNVTVSDSFENVSNATINARRFTLSALADDFILQNISANAFDLLVGGDFIYDNASNDLILSRNSSIVIQGNIFVTADNFSNYGKIDVVNDFNVVANDFDNSENAVINVNDFNAVLSGLFQNNEGTINANTFNVLAFNFSNSADAVIDVNNFNATIAGLFQNSNGGIDANNNFNVTAGDFENSSNATINATNFNVTAGDFENSNNATITARNSFNVIAGDFENSNNATINADVITISTDFFNARLDGNIDAGIFDSINVGVAGTLNLFVAAGDVELENIDKEITYNFRLGGNFIYNDVSNDFIWRRDDRLVVLGTAFINANNYDQTSGSHIDANILNISISGNAFLDGSSSITANQLDFQAGGNFYNRGNIAVVNTANFDIGGEFGIGYPYPTAYFDPNGLANQTARISAGDFNATVGGLFHNYFGSIINANNFNVVAGDFWNQINSTIDVENDFNVIASDFYNSYSAAINADDFNVTADRFYNKYRSVDYDFDGQSFQQIYFVNPTINATNFNVTAGNLFENAVAGIINADNFNVAVSGDFINRGYYNISRGFFGEINANNFNVTADNFENTVSASINADTLTISTNSFVNTNASEDGDGNINADTLNLSLPGDFDYASGYLNNGNININNLNLQVGGDFSYDDVNNDFVWNAQDSLVALGNVFVTADNFSNYGAITTNTLNLFLAGDFNYSSSLGTGNFDVARFNLRVGGDFNYDDVANDFVWNAQDSLVVLGNSFVTVDNFTNYGQIGAANSFNITANNFENSNNATISADTLAISANSFVNAESGDGNIIVNTLNLSLAGDFDYASDYLNNGNINANNLNLQIGGDFSYDDVANNFVWNAQDSLVALGNVSVNVADFTNYGQIDAANNFNITANNFENSNNATINADTLTIATNSFVNTDVLGDGNIIANTLNLSLPGDFDYASDYLNNGNITADALNLRLGGDFNYDDVSNDFVWNAQDSLVALGDVFITTNNFSNYGAITADALNVSLIGDFNYSNSLGAGKFDVTSFNLQVGGDFSYDDVNNDFVWNASDSLVVLGNASVTVDDFTNYGQIDVANNFNLTASNFENSATINADTLTIAANSFVNAEASRDGNINADTLNLSLAGDFDYSSDYLNNGNISANALNLQVGGDFNYDDVANDFVWNAQNSLVVLGDAFVNVADFTNYGQIDAANSLNVTASNFENNGNATINAASLNVTVTADFRNNANLELGTGYVIAGNFINRSYINANSLNVTVTGDFENDNNATINAVDLNVTIATGNFENKNNSTISADNFATTVAGDFENDNNATINAGNFSATIATDFFNYYDSNIVANNFDVIAVNFYNQEISTISAADFNVTVTADFTNSVSEITANNFNVVANNFINFYDKIDLETLVIGDGGVINASNFNVTANTFYNLDNSQIYADDFSVTASNFLNQRDGLIEVTNELTISTDSFLNTDELGRSGNISADTFTLSLENSFDYETDFVNNGNIDATHQNFIVRNGDFNNGTDILLTGNLGITADNFTNTNGNITTDVFSLSVAGNFDHQDDFLNNGSIDTNALNFTIGGDFNYDDLNSSFDWNAQSSLLVFGDASITAESLTNYGEITVSAFDAVVADDFYSTGTLSSTILDFVIGGDLVYEDENSNFNVNNTLEVQGNASVTSNSFTNTGAVNVGNSLNITAGHVFENTNGSTIIVNDVLDIYSTHYINRGNISADTLNVSYSSGGAQVFGDYDVNQENFDTH